MRSSIRSTDISRSITQVCPSRSTNLVSPAKSSSSTGRPRFSSPYPGRCVSLFWKCVLTAYLDRGPVQPAREILSLDVLDAAARE